MQILIVEDEQKIAQVLRRGFLEERYQADIASDGEEALYKCALNAYDLIVLDLMIPKIGGVEVCRTIRGKDSGPPILILTSRDTVEDKVAGLDAGADDYLTKPFSFAELLARIRALLRRGKTARQQILRARLAARMKRTSEPPHWADPLTCGLSGIMTPCRSTPGIVRSQI